MTLLSSLNRLVGSFGYPTPLPALISFAPVDMSLSLNGSTGLRVYFNGDITTEKGATVERGSKLSGDVTVLKNAKIGEGSTVSGNVTVGRYSRLNGNNYVVGDVEIGQFCAIAPRSAFWARNHDTSDWAMQHSFQTELGIDWDVEDGPIRIGSDVWVGLNGMVLPGVEVGHGACIGAQSVVTRDVEPYEVVAGNPAEHVGWRFDEETRKTMLDKKWWERSLEEISEIADELGNN